MSKVYCLLRNNQIVNSNYYEEHNELKFKIIKYLVDVVFPEIKKKFPVEIKNFIRVVFGKEKIFITEDNISHLELETIFELLKKKFKIVYNIQDLKLEGEKNKIFILLKIYNSGFHETLIVHRNFLIINERIVREISRNINANIVYQDTKKIVFSDLNSGIDLGFSLHIEEHEI